MVLQSTELPFITKVLIPKRREYVLPRSRLLDFMSGQVKRKAQIVRAPAGYGKTALLIDFVSQIELPTCWYSFGPEDYDPVSFLRYCLQSINSEFSGFGDYLQTQLRGDGGADWHTQYGLFISALHSDIQGPLVFVLDDLHLIQGRQELEEALSLLIQRAPPNIHFTLSSRSWPALSCLPRLLAANDLAMLDANDLRFSPDETVQLLSRFWDQPVTPEAGQAINDRTGGWAAAIMLTAKRPAQATLPDPVHHGDEDMLFNYLSEEVFDHLPDSLQAFLLQTSILREFSAELCGQLLGLDDPAAQIAQIRDRGLFLEERASGGATFAYHDLFRQYLKARFQHGYPEECGLLNRRVAEIYQDVGDDDTAIYHYLEGGDTGQAANVVKRVADTFFAQGRWQRLATWLSGIPREAIEADPELLLLEAQVQLRLGNPAESLSELEGLIASSHTQDRQILGRALVARSNAYRRLGELDRSVASAQEAITILADAPCPQEHLADGYKQLGDAYSAMADYGPAQANLETALDLTGRDNPRLHAMVSNDLGVVFMESGHLDQAALYLEQARVGLLKLGNDGPLADVLINLSLVYYQQGEFDLALDEAREALRTAEAANYPRVVATALMNQGIVQQALGAYRESLDSASRALTLSRQLMDQRLISESTNVLGNAYRKLGETSKAEVLLAQAALEAESSGQKYIAACFRLSLGKVYYKQGAHRPALEHLQQAETQLLELNSLRRVAEAKLYQAAEHYQNDDIKKAVTCLGQVSDLVAELGHDGFLLADGKDLLEVLRFGAVKRVGNDAFVRLVNRLSPPSGQPDESSAPRPYQIGQVATFPPIQAFAFGSHRVVLDTHEIADSEWRSRKAKELFFFLLHHRRHISSEEIIDALWPEDSLDLSTSALKTNIYRLRQALFFDCILARESGYCVNPEVSINFDLEAFQQNLQLASTHRDDESCREEHLERAISLYDGPFLSGVYSEWCQELRTDLEMKYHTALLTLASYRASQQDYSRATELLEKVVAADPFNEEAQYRLIAYHIRNSDPLQAMQRLRKYARFSMEELGTNLPRRFANCHRRIVEMMPSTA